ncbi:MAG: glycosyltransferase [Chloroflexota bacterium]|nr:glycosyltransferase [Chloroflexota bacterium]
MSGLKVSAVICTRDRPDFLAACLKTVLACPYRPREVLVVDQSDDAQTAAIVAGWQARAPGLVYVRTSTRGLSAARNVAVARATGEVLAFTDDDCLVDADWIGALAAEFLASPQVGAVFGRALPLVEVPLVVRAASVRTDQVARLFRRPCSPWRVGNGSNMAFRATTLRVAGPFDEQLGPGAPLRAGEEADLIYRLLQQGIHLLFSPRPLVYHRQWRSAAAQLALAHDYGVGIGAFCAKYLLRGDARALRALGGWTVAGLADVAGDLRAHDRGRVRAGAALLAGLALGAIQRSTHGSTSGTSGWKKA